MVERRHFLGAWRGSVHSAAAQIPLVRARPSHGSPMQRARGSYRYFSLRLLRDGAPNSLVRALGVDLSYGCKVAA
jgi:hypothetical protein